MKEDFELNPNACSINDLNAGCVQLWTLCQQEAIRRLCVKTRVECKKPARYELVKDFSTRAARIAGNYARIYLELEHNGQPAQKGRFYWTGLAAFASKQVMCALDYSSNTKMRYLPPAVPPLEITKLSLGKGNFWLFQDIFVWHWFYINYPEQFNECVNARDFDTYEGLFKESFAQLSWIEDNLKLTKQTWVSMRIFNRWIFYNGDEYLDLRIQRENGKDDPQNRGLYLFTWTFKSESEFYADFVEGEDRKRWKELLPAELTRLAKEREKTEAQLKKMGIQIDETYKDAKPPVEAG